MTNYPSRMLRLADGGNVITRWAQNVMRPTQNRLRSMDAPPPQPVVVPPVQTAAPVTPDNPAGIRFADGGAYKKGSTGGGKVIGPGTGISDSVPARYSNGEYVLPADTAKAIGYDELDEIKDATHTPAAVQRGLRNGGSDGQGQNDEIGMGGRQAGVSDGVQERSGVVGASSSARLGDQSGLRGGSRIYPLEQVEKRALRLADGGIPGIDVLERPFTSTDSRAFAPQPGPGNPNIGPNGSSQAQSFRAPSVASPAASPTPSIPATPRPTLRAGVAAQPTALSKSTFVAGRAVNGVAKLANSPLGRAAGGAGVVANFNDYKIDDPDVDSSAGGTLRALGNGDFAGAGRSLSKGALETGMDLGSFVANTADFFVPGKAPVSTAYNKMLRNQFGDQLAPNAAVTAQVNAATGSPGAAPVAPTAPSATATTPGAGDATMPGQDPNRVTLRGQGGTEVDGAPGVRKFVQNGKTLYSNVTGPDNDKLMSNKPGVSVVPGMSRQAIDAALGGMSAGQVSSDNAIRAANLRDGVDMERGTQGGKAARDEQQLQDLALSPAGTNGRTFAQKQLGLRMADATTRRSQDITERGNIMQNDTTLRNNRATRDAAALNALREQGNSDRTFGAGRDDARFTQSEKAEKDFTESILQAHTSTVDGKPVIDQNGAKQTRQAFDTMIAKQIQDLQRSGSPEDLARAKNLADNKINAVDPATRQKVIAAVRLMNKVGVDGSNLNPFKPDHMGTSDPRDFMDLKKNKSGDYETKTGKVIPARYFATQGADRFGGVPTNEFDILKGQ